MKKVAVCLAILMFALGRAQVSYSESVPESQAESKKYELQLLEMLATRPEQSAFAKQRLGIVYFSRGKWSAAVSRLESVANDPKATPGQISSARLYIYRTHASTKSSELSSILQNPGDFLRGCSNSEPSTQALVWEISEAIGLDGFIDGRIYGVISYLGDSTTEGLDRLATILMQSSDSPDPKVVKAWQLAAKAWSRRFPVEEPTIHIHRAVLASELGVERIPFSQYRQLFLTHPNHKNKWGINVIYGAIQAAEKENKYRECLQLIAEFEELEARLPQDQKMGPEWAAPILQTKAICQAELGMTDDAVQSARGVRTKYPDTVSAKMIEKYSDGRIPLLSRSEVVAGWVFAIAVAFGVLRMAFRPRSPKKK